MGRNWHRFDAAVVAAGYAVALTAPQSFTDEPQRDSAAGGWPDDGADTVLAALADLQGVCWAAIARVMHRVRGSVRNLSADLYDFIHPDSVLPGSVDRFLLELAPDLSSKNSRSHRLSLRAYRMHAVIAAVSLAATRPNPFESTWAQQYISFEITRRFAGDAFSSSWASSILPPTKFAPTIGHEAAWNATERWIRALLDDEGSSQDASSPVFDALSEIVADLSRPKLVDQVMTGLGAAVEVPKGSPEAILQALRGIPDPLDRPQLILVANILCDPLVTSGLVDDLESVADALVEHLGGGDEARAEVDVWLGTKLIQLREPARMLARIGSHTRCWESGLPARTRSDLWLLRSNALRMNGQLRPALAQAEAVGKIDDATCDARALTFARLTRAIIHREIGSPDMAIQELEELLRELTAIDRLSVLPSLAGTYLVAGRYDEAADRFAEARQLAAADGRATGAHFATAEAAARANAGQHEAALHILAQLSLSADCDEVTTVTELSVWTVIRSAGMALPASSERRTEDLIPLAEAIAWRADARGDEELARMALDAAATAAAVCGLPVARRLWGESSRKASAVGAVPHAVGSLIEARDAYRDRDLGTARGALATVSSWIAQNYGVSDGIGAVLEGLAPLGRWFGEVTQAAIEGDAPASDLRVLADLRRDALSHARLRRGGSVRDAPVQRDLDDGSIARLAPQSGKIAVLEWIEGVGCVIPLLTTVSASGAVCSTMLGMPALDLADLSRRIGSRLQNWRPGRSGEPFAFEAWSVFEGWILHAMLQTLSPGDHVVFIEHREFPGLPLHVAVAPHFPSSYASGWKALLSFDVPPRPSSRPVVGIVSVPRSGEHSSVLGPMRASATRTVSFAQARGAPVESATGRRADRARTFAVLQRSYLVKFLCHGYVSREENDVALLLAADGVLPLAHSIAAGSQTGRVHRLGWSDCEALERAPAVVFSAACSSGHSHIVGLGERLGLYGSFRKGGTVAMIAPRWDAVAAHALPILDEALERHVEACRPLGVALWEACNNAERRGDARWLAWTLALEGDWR